MDVAVHCGAQSTADTVALAEHAAELGVAGVAVIAPPYFQLDDRALLDHFAAAAAACAPTPFYVYEFASTSGYAVPPHVVVELGDRAPNLAGLKVSDTPWESFEPYLIEGLDVFVGPESLIARGRSARVRWARSPRSPRRSRSSSPPASASRRTSAPRGSPSSGPRSSAFLATPR